MSGIQIHPRLDLARYAGWEKTIAALRFLPEAYDAIKNRRLRPTHTFHLVDCHEVPIGVSSGDVCYAASDDDGIIGSLVIEFEDRRYYSHLGIDLIGIIRAIRSNLFALRVVQGGSTITQQLVRNTLLTPDRSVTRKILEIVLAVLIERHYSKREILALYCQCVVLGPGVRGFQAASRLLYRRTLANLDVVSLCGLVGLLRQPSRFYPGQSRNLFVQRQTFMARLHTKRKTGQIATNNVCITERLPNPIPVSQMKKPRLTLVMQQVCREQGLASEDIKRVGFTIDRALQARVDLVLRHISRSSDIERIAAVVLSNRQCEVLAESVFANGQECEFSPTFTRGLQPGSTFKPFAVLAALEEGYTPDISLISAPFESTQIKNTDGSSWRVRNYAHKYRENLTLTDALRFSDNTAFARLCEMIPLRSLESVYCRFGLSEFGSTTPAIVLGAVNGGVSLLRLVAAYATIARNGVYIEPRILRFIHYADGSTWWPQVDKDKVVTSYSAATLLKMILAGTLPQLAPFGFSGKTGTTQTGSLVAAYNDEVSVAVWLGNRGRRSENDNKGWSALRAAERLIAEGLLGHSRNPFKI